MKTLECVTLAGVWVPHHAQGKTRVEKEGNLSQTGLKLMSHRNRDTNSPGAVHDAVQAVGNGEHSAV